MRLIEAALTPGMIVERGKGFLATYGTSSITPAIREAGKETSVS
jgi:hypothetical protein